MTMLSYILFYVGCAAFGVLFAALDCRRIKRQISREPNKAMAAVAEANARDEARIP